MRSALGFLIAYACLVGVTHAQDIAVANATVLINGGRVVAVGKGVSVPPGVQTLPCGAALSSQDSGIRTSTSLALSGTMPQRFLPIS